MYYIISRLERDGHLAESTPEIPREVAAFWHALGIPPRDAIRSLASKSIRVRALGSADATPLLEALREFGIRLVDDDDADMEAVLTNDYLLAELSEINSAALQSNKVWLLARPMGIEIRIGPLFVPGVTACHRCLSDRLRRHRIVDQFVAEKNGLAELPSAAFAALRLGTCVTSFVAALEIAKVLVGAGENLRNRVLNFNTKTWAAETHVLTRHPHCSSCGHPPSGPNPNFVLF